MKDETLADVAAHPPASQDDLARGARPFAGLGVERYRRAADERAGGGQAADRRTRCRRARTASPGSARKARWSPTCSSCCSRSARRETDVAARLIARSEELELLAAGRREGLSILEGWRFEQFGRDALDLVEGRLAFAVQRRQAEDDADRSGGGLTLGRQRTFSSGRAAQGAGEPFQPPRHRLTVERLLALCEA